jgi:hypothetical protein
MAVVSPAWVDQCGAGKWWMHACTKYRCRYLPRTFLVMVNSRFYCIPAENIMSGGDFYIGTFVGGGSRSR